MKRSKFKKWLLEKYFLVIRSKETRQKYIGIKFSRLSIFIIFSTLVFIILVFGFSILYSNEKVINFMKKDTYKENILESQKMIDSLVFLLESQSDFIENIQEVVFQKKQNTATSKKKKTKNTSPISNNSSIDYKKNFLNAFINEFENYTPPNNYPNVGNIHKLLFFNPIENGIITRNFDMGVKHFGIDLVAKKNQPIVSIADGTVIFSTWTQEFGHTLAIQHNNHQLISFYMHNSVLLKEVGMLVKKGEAIAIIGNSGEFTEGHHLHFELWYQGKALNPRNFFKFR